MIISNPKRDDTKTIIIASIEENPISLNALVEIKYVKYTARMGRII